jgi:uroporphyrinogen-III synthase
MSDGPLVAVLRPDDGRLEDTAEHLRDLGVIPLEDPMLAIEPTGATPREDADLAVFTSTTGARLAAESGWEATDTDVLAIGPSTAEALRDGGYDVTHIPDRFSSTGLVESLAGEAAGRRIEVARSDHGSAVLLDGLAEAGAYVHETVLYRLTRPEEAGESVERAIASDLDGILFTSSLTVEHFLAAAEGHGSRAETLAALNERAVVGAIGEPTRETAATNGLAVDVVPEQADVCQLASAVVHRARTD